MTRLFDLRLESSGRFDTIRRVEYVVLLVFAAFGVFVLPAHGSIGALPLLLLALMLVPGKRYSPNLERIRVQTLNELQQEGLALRSKWVIVTESPPAASTSSERWRIEREALLWMTDSTNRLERFPELVGIFTGRDKRDDVIEELDDCLAVLSRLRRLVSLSESLKLPI